MRDERKSKRQLIDELVEQRQRVAELEQSAVRDREKKRQLQHLLDSLTDGVALVDLDARYTMVNNSLLEMQGFVSSEQMLGRSALSFIAPQDLERGMADLARTLEQGCIVRAEYAVLKSDGTQFPAELSGAVVKDTQGNPTGFSVVLRDISERKRAEEALREAEKRYRAVFDSQLQMVYLNDVQGMFVDANDYALERLGYTRNDLGKLSFQDVVHPEDLPRIVEGLSQILAEGFMERSLEVRLIAKSGEIVWVKTFGVPLEHNPSHFLGLGIAYDITGQKQAEKELRIKESAIASSINAIAMTDLEGRIAYVNPSALRLWGYEDQDEVLGRPASEFMELTSEPTGLAETLYESGGWVGEMVAIRKDGSPLDVQLSASLVTDEAGEPICTLASFIDISERKEAEEALRKSEEKLRIMFDSVSDGIGAVDMNGVYTEANQGLLEAYGCDSLEQVLGKNYFTFVAPRDVEDMLSEMLKAMAEESITRREYTGVRADGTEFPVEASGKAMKDSSGNPVGFIGIIRDITERKQREQALRDSEKRYRLLAETVRDIIWTTDAELRFTYISPAAKSLLGYEVDEYTGRSVKEIMSPESFTVTLKALMEALAREGVAEAAPTEGEILELELVRQDGSTVWTESKVTFLRDVEGRPVGSLGVTRDITERKRAEEIVRHMAYHDPLTGLPNRLLFSEILDHELLRAQRNQHKVAVLLLDLDEFKSVNDALGHPVGDQLLKAVADRLRRSVRKADTVARMGGDEFMVILPEITRVEDAAKVALKVHDTFRKPFVLGDHRIRITGSIGIAIYPEDGTETESLMKNVDIAMYHAKGHGGNGYRYYASAKKDQAPIASQSGPSQKVTVK